jgi:hypothetical protein
MSLKILWGQGFCPAAELPLGVYRGTKAQQIPHSTGFGTAEDAGQKPGGSPEGLPHRNCFEKFKWYWCASETGESRGMKGIHHVNYPFDM